MMTIQKQDLRELFDPVKVDGRTFWRCRKCGKLLIARFRGEHLKRKHSEVRLSGPTPTPDRIREAWIRWYESGPHNVDLSATLEFRDLTVGSMEPEISRMHVRTGVLEKCPRCGHTWERLSKVGGKSTCPHCGKHYEQEAIT